MRLPITLALLTVFSLCLGACGAEDAPRADTPGQARPPVEGMPTRSLSEDELALVGLWSLQLPGSGDQPGLTVELDLFAGGAQRFTIHNAPGTEPGTVQTNEGVWWLEGLDRLLLSPRRSQGKELPAGSAPETVLRITEAGLLLQGAPTDQPLVRQKR